MSDGVATEVVASRAMRVGSWLVSMLLLSQGCGGVAPLPCSGEPAPASPPSVADDDFVARYAATMGFRLGRPASIRVTPDGDAVLFLRSGPRSFVRDLYSHDVATGEERVLLTAAQILRGAEEELSAEERARRERLRLVARGIASYELSADGQRILVPLSGRLFVVARGDGRVREIGTAEGYPNEARFSPDGSKVACVRDGDLYVIDVETGAERRLTDDARADVINGMPEFVAQEEMGRFQGYWWSPDGGRLAYQQTDTSGVEVLRIVDPTNPAGAPHEAPYPRPGRANASVRLGFVSIDGGDTRWVDWDREAFPYLATVRWSTGAPLTLVVQNRRQTEHRILTVDERTGATRTLHVETDDAWINLDQEMPVWVAGGDAFLWTTERNGSWQLELRGRDGALLRALTEPGLGLESVAHVEVEAGVAWVLASAEPTETHVFRVQLGAAGPEPLPLTRERGVHEVFVGGGGVRLVHSRLASGEDTFRVFRSDEEVGELRSAAEPAGIDPEPEWVTVGERGYRAVVIRPRNFERGRRYPVLVSVYGGPHVRTVQATPRLYLLQQWYADHGFIVVSMDGRGTPGRGRAWERAIRGNFIALPLEDQVAALQALGERFEEMDLSRVGIWGWSFGGYFSAMAVMRRPDVFHVGVAGAPVADWRDYDTHYTERYIGLPDENRDGYEDSSVLSHAATLERPLLIVHGTVDDNVYFTHAVKMSDALLRAGREHGFLPLSGFTHMVSEPEVALALHQRVLGFLARNLR